MTRWVMLMAACLVPQCVFGSVIIHEIMYAPEGTDTKHEWVEVCAMVSTNITDWKFFEADVNHALTLVSGTGALATNECAIIADDAATFAADYPSFSGVLFDSVFSLSNTGETIALKDDESTTHDSVSYNESLGAKDDGLSIHRVDASFVAGTPSPGAASSSSASSSQTASSSSASSSGGAPRQIVTTYEYLSVEPPQDIFVRVEADTVASVGTRVRFVGELYNARGIAETDGTIFWNFGDGTSFEGRVAEHVFAHTGTYAVSVRAKHGAFESKALHTITLVEPLVSVRIASDKKRVSILNEGEHSFLLGGFRLVAGGSYFVFPDETVLTPGEVSFSNEVLKLYQLGASPEVVLFNAGGDMVARGSVQDEFFTKENVVAEGDATAGAVLGATQNSKAPLRVAQNPAKSIIGTVVPHSEVPSLGEVTTQSVVPIQSHMFPVSDPATQLAASAVTKILPTSYEWWIAFALLALVGVLGIFVAFVRLEEPLSRASDFTVVEDTNV